MMKITAQFFTCIVLLFCTSCSAQNSYTRINGFAQGTTYAITYEGNDALQPEIEALLTRFDNSLSVYNRSSIISKVNHNEKVELDSFFITCFALAQKVSKETNGAFDMSAAPIFAAWGFGEQQITITPTQRQVDSLKQLCGMDKIRIVNNRMAKTDPRVTINANAVAKGYSADVVSRFLESRGKKNYLVEIGGEIFCRGINSKGTPWVIGIDRPKDGNFVPGADLQAKVLVSGKGLATSGNYRKFYIQNGKKYAHTINPQTGYPTQNSILSTTVIAPTCGEADAYATAFMVMGLDSSKKFLQQHPELDVYIIYSTDNDKFHAYATPGFTQSMVK